MKILVVWMFKLLFLEKGCVVLTLKRDSTFLL
jgi:hypothetical protein